MPIKGDASRSRNNDTSLASVLVQPSLLTAKIRLPDSDESVYLRRRFFSFWYLCTRDRMLDGVNGGSGIMDFSRVESMIDEADRG